MTQKHKNKGDVLNKTHQFKINDIIAVAGV